MFTNLKVSTLIALFKDEASAQSIFTLIFERTCRDINDKNVKVLDELFELLQQFEANEQSQQKILLEIAVLVVGDLSKDKKNRAHCDKFRDILFEIIKDVAKKTNDTDWLIDATLPAFVIVVKAYIAVNKSNSNAAQEANDDDQTVQLIKLFLRNSVIPLTSSQNDLGDGHYFNLEMKTYESDIIEMVFSYRLTVETSIRSNC